MDNRGVMQKFMVDQYEINSKIGSGAFGDIHIGRDTRTNMLVAVKIEETKSKSPQLQSESKLYTIFNGGYGIPKMYLFKPELHQNVLVMDLLGPSLEDLFTFCDRKFSEKTVYQLAIEMITRVEYIHHCNFIHRDIKPDNFVIGMGENANLVYIIDYGLSKRYFNPQTGQHIPYRENRHLTGTPRYASLANHLGIEQSRRDDLESLGYVFLYFLKSKLPWQGLNAYTKKQKYNKIMEYKIENNFKSLCTSLPQEFVAYFDYCRSLRFDDTPDYNYVRSLFETCLKKINATNDGVYDWMTDNEDINNCLPKHCKTSESRLKKEFMKPAPYEMRTNMAKDLIPYAGDINVYSMTNNGPDMSNPNVIPFNKYVPVDIYKQPLASYPTNMRMYMNDSSGMTPSPMMNNNMGNNMVNNMYE